MRYSDKEIGSVMELIHPRDKSASLPATLNHCRYYDDCIARGAMVKWLELLLEEQEGLGSFPGL